MLTAKIHEPGSRVIRNLQGVLKTRVVPTGRILVSCEACEYDCEFPERLRDEAEQTRQTHLRTVHWTDQLKGRVCIDPELTSLKSRRKKSA